MKKNLQYIGLAMMLGLASCTTETMDVKNVSSSLQIAVQTKNAQKGRGLVDSSGLPDGSDIALRLVDQSGITYDGADFQLFTATASTGASPQTWSIEKEVPLTNNSGTLYAFWPYTDDVTDLTAIQVVSGDTDYMYSTPVTGLNAKNPNAEIVMNHALTAVRLTLSKGSYTGGGEVSNLTLQGNVAKSAVLDATTGSFSQLVLGDIDILQEQPITLSNVPSVLTMLVIPTADTGDLNFSMTIDGIDLESSLPSCQLAPGSLLEIQASMNGSELVVNNVAIQPWTNDTNYSGIVGDSEFDVTLVYNLTAPTNFYFSSLYVSFLRINGQTMPLKNSYDIELTGLCTLDIKFKNDVNTLSSNFIKNKNFLIYANIGGGVTSIEYCAFDGCTGLKSAVIGSGVQTIGDYAFRECTGLTEITILNSVTAIGNFAFDGCSGLTEITIPNSVQTIGGRSFSNCTGLTGTLTIPNSVQTIGDYAFAYCDKLTEVTIGSGVQTIGNRAFDGCSGLTGTLTIPNSVQTIGDYAFYGCSGLTGTLTIPNSVQTIGDYAFYGCSGLTEVTIGSGVQTIGNRAFRECTGLTALDLGTGVQTIGEYAFSWCDGLTEITIPNSVTNIGEYAFRACSGLKSAVIGSGVQTIGERVFLNCSGLTSISVDAGNSVYDSRNNCDAIMETVTNTLVIGCKNTVIPEDCQTIGEYAFYICTGLTEITIPNSVQTIGDRSFQACSGLTEVIIGSGVQTIGEYAFQECSGLASISVDVSNSVYDSRNNCNAIMGTVTNTLVIGCKNTVIPEDCQTIGDKAFYYCTGLTEITIPNSVTSIGNYAFAYCKGLKRIKSLAITGPVIQNYTFSNIKSNGVLYLPNGYTGYDTWKNILMKTYDWTVIE